jgi:hypothetical protein
VRRIAVVALLAVVAAGCGGSSATSSYTLAATKECLQNSSGVTIAPTSPDDFVASTASGGAFQAQLPDANAVTLLFGQSPEEAANLADAYRRFRAKNVGIEDILRTQGNVVLLWKLHPSTSDESLVNGCLK